MAYPTYIAKSDSIVTIERHILEQQRYHPEATGVLTSLLYDLALAGKMVTSQMARAGLAQILGKTDKVNIQGEEVMKLDQLADETIYMLNDHTGRLAVARQLPTAVVSLERLTQQRRLGLGRAQ